MAWAQGEWGREGKLITHRSCVPHQTFDLKCGKILEEPAKLISLRAAHSWLKNSLECASSVPPTWEWLSTQFISGRCNGASIYPCHYLAYKNGQWGKNPEVFLTSAGVANTFTAHLRCRWSWWIRKESLGGKSSVRLENREIQNTADPGCPTQEDLHKLGKQ